LCPPELLVEPRDAIGAKRRVALEYLYPPFGEEDRSARDPRLNIDVIAQVGEKGKVRAPCGTFNKGDGLLSGRPWSFPVAPIPGAAWPERIGPFLEAQCICLRTKQVSASGFGGHGFGLSRFERSPQARFLVLITAVEILANEQPRIQREVEFVDRCLRNLETQGLGGAQSLQGGLERLRKESIGAACRRLIRCSLGDEAARRFSRLYGARSRFVHMGRSREAVSGPLGSRPRLVASGSKVYTADHASSRLLRSIPGPFTARRTLPSLRPVADRL